MSLSIEPWHRLGVQALTLTLTLTHRLVTMTKGVYIPIESTIKSATLHINFGH